MYLKKSDQKNFIKIALVALVVILFFTKDYWLNESTPVIGNLVSTIKGGSSKTEVVSNEKSTADSSNVINIMSEYYTYKIGSDGYNKAKAVEDNINCLYSSIVAKGNQVNAVTRSNYNSFAEEFNDALKLKQSVRKLLVFQNGENNVSETDILAKSVEYANKAVSKALRQINSNRNKAAAEKAAEQGFNEDEFNDLYRELRAWETEVIGPVGEALKRGDSKEKIKNDFQKVYNNRAAAWHDNNYATKWNKIKGLSLSGDYGKKLSEMKAWYTKQDDILYKADLK